MGLIVLQLSCSSLIVHLLDELVSLYGLGSGISLFIAVGICERIVWQAFSPTTFNTDRGIEFYGAIVAAFHILITRPDKVAALREAFYRANLPNLSNLVATLGVFFVVLYIQGMRVELSLTKDAVRGAPERKFPIKLFYTSNMPVILVSSIVQQIHYFSKILQNKYGRAFIVTVFG